MQYITDMTWIGLAWLDCNAEEELKADNGGGPRYKLYKACRIILDLHRTKMLLFGKIGTETIVLAPNLLVTALANE